jgi:signal transduction histidine kinase
MPPEVVARLGEPFFTTRGDRGSGLGVGICRRIVEEHGGTLAFSSAPGRGTTAVVRLPTLGDP